MRCTDRTISGLSRLPRHFSMIMRVVSETTSRRTHKPTRHIIGRHFATLVEDDFDSCRTGSSAWWILRTTQLSLRFSWQAVYLLENETTSRCVSTDITVLSEPYKTNAQLRAAKETFPVPTKKPTGLIFRPCQGDDSVKNVEGRLVECRGQHLLLIKLDWYQTARATNGPWHSHRKYLQRCADHARQCPVYQSTCSHSFIPNMNDFMKTNLAPNAAIQLESKGDRV